MRKMVMTQRKTEKSIIMTKRNRLFPDVLSLKATKSVESFSVLPIKIYHYAKQPSKNMFLSSMKQDVSMSVIQHMVTCL
jgi:hypothetical protein